MATIFLRHVKLPRIFKLSSISKSSTIFHSRAVTFRRELHNNKIYLATAAIKPESNYDHVKNVQVTHVPTQTSSNEGVDKVLERIDMSVKRTGRTLSKHVFHALSLLSGVQGEITSNHGLYLLRACKYVYDIPPKEKTQLVNEVWNGLHELGMKFDVVHYNALLGIHILHGFDFNPVDILASIEDEGLVPNITTYMYLLQKYCKDGNLTGAGEILEFIKEKGFSANEEVFNCLIEGHLMNDDFAGALDMLEVMRSSNLTPNENTYTILACGYATKGDSKAMFSSLDEAKNGVTFSIQNYLQVIKALASSGHLQHIDEVLSMITKPYEYCEEFTNAALDLLHMDAVDIAYKLTLASNNPVYNTGVAIFIKQLIKSGKPFSQIMQFVNDIKSKGMYDGLLPVLTRYAAENGNIDCALSFIEERLKEGEKLRVSCFTQLYSVMKTADVETATWSMLKKMSELGIPADFTTHLEFILPAFGTPDFQPFLTKVKESGQCANIAANALFVHYCDLGEFSYALELANYIPVRVSHKLDMRSFLDKYETLKQSPSFTETKYFKVLLYILNNSEYLRDTDGFRGKLLADFIMAEPDIFEKFLKRIKNNKETLECNDQVLNACYHYLAKRDPPSLMLFSKLRITSINSKQKDMTFKEELQEIELLYKRGLMCKPFILDRIAYHVSLKDVDRVKKLESEFLKYEFAYTPLLVSQLLTLYISTCDLSKVEDLVKELKNFPTFRLDVIKILNLSILYVKYMKYGEAIEVLKTHLSKPFIYNSKESVLNCMKKFFSVMRDTGDMELLKNAQSCMAALSEEVKDVKKTLLGQSIVLHIQRNDLKSAYDDYYYIIKNHRIPVSLNIFLKKCLSLNDNTMLQNVVDITNECIGRQNTSIELVVALVELGRYTQADKVIQNLGDHTDAKYVYDAATKLAYQNKVLDLERFIEVLKPIVNVDREMLYQMLLRKIAEQNDFEKAIEIYDKLKKEEIEPCEETNLILRNILKKNNQPIPFELSSNNVPNTAIDDTELPGKHLETFISSLEKKDMELAVNEIRNMKKGYVHSIPFKYMTDWIRLCIEHDRISDITPHSIIMPYIIDNVKNIIKPLLEEYSSSGDVKSVSAIASFIPDFALKDVAFNFYFCNAYLKSGSHEDLLCELDKHLEKKIKIFSMSAFEELLNKPGLESRAFDLAVKYFNENFSLPIAVVWINEFSKKNYDKAKEIFKVYPFEMDRVDNKVLRIIRDNNDVDMGKEYIKFVVDSSARQRVIERAYGAVLDILVRKEMHDEAAALVVEAQNSQLPLHKYYPSSLTKLKNALEKENKPVPFTIQTEEVPYLRESRS